MAHTVVIDTVTFITATDSSACKTCSENGITTLSHNLYYYSWTDCFALASRSLFLLWRERKDITSSEHAVLSCDSEFTDWLCLTDSKLDED